MKTLKLIAIAATVAFAAPVLAGPDATQLAVQKRAYERQVARSAAAGGSAPAHKVDAACPLIQHPGERVRR